MQSVCGTVCSLQSALPVRVRLRRNLTQLEGATKRASTRPHRSTRDPSSSCQRISKKKKKLVRKKTSVSTFLLVTQGPASSSSYSNACDVSTTSATSSSFKKSIIQRLTRDESVRRHASDLDGEWSLRVETVVDQRSPPVHAKTAGRAHAWASAALALLPNQSLLVRSSVGPEVGRKHDRKPSTLCKHKVQTLAHTHTRFNVRCMWVTLTFRSFVVIDSYWCCVIGFACLRSPSLAFCSTRCRGPTFMLAHVLVRAPVDG